jgi:CRP-like cAMP-binding protein
VVREGEPGDRFFALRSGAVVVEHELPSGLTREVARLGAGDCFGETALLDRVPRTASVRAQQPRFTRAPSSPSSPPIGSLPWRCAWRRATSLRARP